MGIPNPGKPPAYPTDLSDLYSSIEETEHENDDGDLNDRKPPSHHRLDENEYWACQYGETKESEQEQNEGDLDNRKPPPAH